MTMEPFWLGPLAWAVLYSSDLILTITCARRYQVQDKIVFEGSFEITPFYQADVNALRYFSPRFLMVLLGSTAYAAVLSIYSERWNFRGPYVAAIGALLLIQLTIHIRHLRNLFQFRKASVDALSGRIVYPRGLLLRASALELLLFAVLYTTLAIVTSSLFVAGGAVACVVLSLNHHRLARRHEASGS